MATKNNFKNTIRKPLTSSLVKKIEDEAKFAYEKGRLLGLKEGDLHQYVYGKLYNGDIIPQIELSIAFIFDDVMRELNDKYGIPEYNL